MKRSIAIFFITLFLMESALWAGLGSDKTMYVGGTVNAIKEGSEGKSSAKDEKNFVFSYQGGQLAIPYDRVNDLEYGQKRAVVWGSRLPSRGWPSSRRSGGTS